jgi:hypothetical protein
VMVILFNPANAKNISHQRILSFTWIILQKFIQRSLIWISSEIIEESHDETTDVLIDSWI